MIKILIISELKLGMILIYKWLEEKHETNFLRSFTKLSCTSILSIHRSRKNKQSTIFLLLPPSFQKTQNFKDLF
jgi:hypothetical protein